MLCDIIFAMNKILIANWKMNPTSEKEAKKLVKEYVKEIKVSKGVDVVACPPFQYISTLRNEYSGTKISLGAQDVFYEKAGPYTGEVSVDSLIDLKVSYVIVGHSERRSLGEINEDVAKKVKVCIKSGLVPVICIGEKERDTDGKYLRYLEKEIIDSLEGISRNDISKLVIAYEPIWAIGKNEPMSGYEMHQMSIYIRKVLVKKYGKNSTNKIRVIYGGSINDSNANDMVKNGNIDGLIIGRASLDAKQVFSLTKLLAKI